MKTGGTTAWDGNIEPFFKRGGRLITYVCFFPLSF